MEISLFAEVGAGRLSLHTDTGKGNMHLINALCMGCPRKHFPTIQTSLDSSITHLITGTCILITYTY